MVDDSWWRRRCVAISRWSKLGAPIIPAISCFGSLSLLICGLTSLVETQIFVLQLYVSQFQSCLCRCWQNLHCRGLLLLCFWKMNWIESNSEFWNSGRGNCRRWRFETRRNSRAWHLCSSIDSWREIWKTNWGFAFTETEKTAFCLFWLFCFFFSILDIDLFILF